MIKVSLTIIFSCILLQGIAQKQGQNKVDSLLLALGKQTKEDTIRLKTIIAVSNEYQFLNASKGVEFGDTAIQLASKLKNNILLASAYQVSGINYANQGNNTKANEQYDKGLSVVSSNGMEEKAARGRILNIKSGAVRLLGRKREAMEILKEAILLNQETGQLQPLAISYNNLGLVFNNLSLYDSAILMYQKALPINEKLGSKRNVAINYVNIGMCYKALAQNRVALDYFEKALPMFEALGDTRTKGITIGFMGLAYSNLGNYSQAIDCYTRAIKLHEKVGNLSDIATAYNNIGIIIFNALEEPNNALTYFEKAIPIDEKTKNKDGLATAYNNIGNIYITQKKFTKALGYFNKALELCFETEDSLGIAFNYQGIGIANLEMPRSDYAIAINKLESAVKMFDFMGAKSDAANASLTLARCYLEAPPEVLFKLGKDTTTSYKTAGNLITNSLQTTKELGVLEVQRDAQKVLSNWHEKQGNYIMALQAYQKYIELKDSIANDKKKKEIARIEMSYEFSKKEDSLKLKEAITKEQLMQQQFLNKQQEQDLLLSRNQLLLSESQLSLSNKDKEIQHLAFLQSQASLQAEQKLRKEKEKANLLEVAKKEKDIQLAKQETLLHLSDKRNTLYLATLTLLLTLLGFAFFVYKSRIKALKKMLEIRNNIASNLHDEVGSTLSSISITSGLLQKQNMAEASLDNNMLQSINTNAQQTLENMKDIVWSINPENDKLQNMLVRMRQFSAELLENQNIDVQFVVSENLQKLQLPMEIRMDVYLIFKEAINNIAKYATASSVTIKFEDIKNQFIMEIRDNGKGFETMATNNTMGGNGLKNMKQRATNIKGSVKVSSTVGIGTSVLLSVPLAT